LLTKIVFRYVEISAFTSNLVSPSIEELVAAQRAVLARLRIRAGLETDVFRIRFQRIEKKVRTKFLSMEWSRDDH